MKFVNNIRCKNLGNMVFGAKIIITAFILTFENTRNLQQLSNHLKDFCNLVLVCNDIVPK